MLKALLAIFTITAILSAESGDLNATTATIEHNSTVENNLTTNEGEQAKEIYLSQIEKNLNTLYLNQIFTIEYKLLILSESFSKITTEFKGGEGASVLNQESEWRKIDNNSYINRFFFKANDTEFVLPNIAVKVFKEHSSEESLLQGAKLSAIELKKDREFCGVIATALDLIDNKSTAYNDSHNILVIELKGLYANLEDFRSQKYKFQGIENQRLELPTSEIIYYAIVPKSLDFFTFDYFNTTENSFKSIKIPNISEDEKVSTQTDIKPKNFNELYKIIIFSGFVILFGALYFIRKNRLYILLAIGSAIMLFTYLIPQKEMELKMGSELRILPTEKSTIFYKTTKREEVTYILKRDGFVKVLFEDGKIGWIKERDIVKN